MFTKILKSIRVFASDPMCADLEKKGYSVESQVWAASFDLYSDEQLVLMKERYISTLSRMYEVKKIGCEYLEAVYALKMMNAKTEFHFLGEGDRAPTLPELAQEWKKNIVFFGAFDGKLLIGVLETKLNVDRVELSYLHVDPERRHEGIATGLTSFAILYWANEGVKHFAAFGDQNIPQRQEVLEHLGFNSHDQLRKYVGSEV